MSRRPSPPAEARLSPAAGRAVALDGSLTVTDLDSGGNLTGATISIGTGFVTGDVLNFTAQNGISATFNATTGVLTLSGTASVANYQTALDLDRVLHHGDGIGISYHFLGLPKISASSSTSATSTVAVQAGPVVAAGASATFTGGGAAVTLDGALTVNDASSTTLASATISIGAGFPRWRHTEFLQPERDHGQLQRGDRCPDVERYGKTLANYQTALDSITFSFSPGTGDPTHGGSDTSRTIGLDGQRRGDRFRCRDEHVEHRACRAGGDGGWKRDLHGWGIGGDIGWLANAERCGQRRGISLARRYPSATGFVTGDVLNFTAQNGISGVYNATTGVFDADRHGERRELSGGAGPSITFSEILG